MTMLNAHAREQSPETIPSLTPLMQLTGEAMQNVNQIIIESMESEVKLIPQMASHLIAAGGKRMRPMLTLAAAMIGQQETDADRLDVRAGYLAAAVEFIHNATLLHDDVIDNSDKRRGQETANALWGNEASVLVGDFLFARAFELMVKTDNISILNMLARASAQIAEGEVKQMSMIGQTETTLDDYISVITNKTAILFAAAAKTGMQISHGSEQTAMAMYAYGLALGRAFQICDDAMDYQMQTEIMGKNAGDDFYEAKITMPVILAYQAGGEDERHFWHRTLAKQEFKEGDLENACMILDRHHAIEQSLNYAKKEADLAVDALEAIADSPIKHALIEAAEFAASRGY